MPVNPRLTKRPGSATSTTKTTGRTTAAAFGAACMGLTAAADADITGFNPFSAWHYNQPPDDTASPADVTGDTLHLTVLSTCERRSAFYLTPQTIGSFTASFGFRASNASVFGCDYGAAFVIQRSPAGSSAVGGTGGGLGYVGIPNSIAVTLQLQSNSTGLWSNGAGGGSVSVAPVSLISGHLINVTLSYDGSILSETLVDTVTQQTFTRNIIAGNIATTIGGTAALVGVTGSTTCGSCSGNTANQYFVGFVYASTPCYTNCDSSTVSPVLNFGDFTCFLQRYAAGDSYANCDGSVAPPVLNVLDFTCFLQKYAAGCP